MANQSVLSVFSFAYRPMMPSSQNDGGFAVNLLDNDILAFTEFDASQRVMRELYFRVSPEVRPRYLRMVNYAMPWLQNVPHRMRLHEGSISEYTFCFCGCEVFRIEDMIQLMDSCSFRSVRGHYTRLVYSLFEDITALLLPCGIDLQPSVFRWDTRVIQPLPPMNTMQQSNFA